MNIIVDPNVPPGASYFLEHNGSILVHPDDAADLQRQLTSRSAAPGSDPPPAVATPEDNAQEALLRLRQRSGVTQHGERTARRIAEERDHQQRVEEVTRQIYESRHQIYESRHLETLRPEDIEAVRRICEAQILHAEESAQALGTRLHQEAFSQGAQPRAEERDHQQRVEEVTRQQIYEAERLGALRPEDVEEALYRGAQLTTRQEIDRETARQIAGNAHAQTQREIEEAVQQLLSRRPQVEASSNENISLTEMELIQRHFTEEGPSELERLRVENKRLKEELKEAQTPVAPEPSSKRVLEV